jgi:hypothetical protein
MEIGRGNIIVKKNTHTHTRGVTKSRAWRSAEYLAIGCKVIALLEILSFATNHYATGMQLVIICNYLGHVCNYKFGIV